MPTELLKNSNTVLPKPSGWLGGGGAAGRGVFRSRRLPDFVAQLLLGLDDMALFVRQHVRSLRAVFWHRPMKTASAL